jgi:hypothetical protein
MTRFSLIGLVMVAATFAGCAGYQPINQNFDEYTTKEIYISSVEVVSPEREVGTRLNAQYLKQLLTRRFIGDENDSFHLDMDVNETSRNISFRIDATAERALVTLDSTAIIRDKEGQVLAVIETRTDAAYEIQVSPFATQANYTQARESAIRDLQRDLQRQLNLFLKDYTKSEETP